jgi:hypothetical protein
MNTRMICAYCFGNMWKESLTSCFEVLSRSFTGRVEVNHEISQVGPTYKSELSRIRSISVSKMTVAFVPEDLHEVFEYDIYRYKNGIVDILKKNCTCFLFKYVFCYLLMVLNARNVTCIYYH